MSAPMLTPRIVAYLGTQEGLVPEAYRDSEGVWTWSMGIATTGGFDVLRYKDHPTPLAECLGAAVDLIRKRYLPAVVDAFRGKDLAESQLAAALSFHWRNGTIGKAQWVKDWSAGNLATAKTNFMQWTNHGKQRDRALTDQALFFNGTWPPSLLVPVYQVAKPSYMPVRATLVDVIPTLQQIMGGK